MFSKYAKIFFIVALTVLFYGGRGAGAAVCTVSGLSWNKNTAAVGEETVLTARGQNCQGTKIEFWIYEQDNDADVTLPSELIYKASARLTASGLIIAEHSFTTEEYELGGNELYNEQLDIHETMLFEAVVNNVRTGQWSGPLALKRPGDQNQCNLSTAEWLIPGDGTPAFGETAIMVVKGGGCRGVEINFQIYEGDDSTGYGKFMETKAVFDQDSRRAEGKWIIARPSGDTLPYAYKFYFRAWVRDGGLTEARSDILTVRPDTSADADKGTGDKTTGDKTSSSNGKGQPKVVKINFGNPIKNSNLVDLADSIAGWLMKIAIPIAVLLIIYAGALMLLSQGNQKLIDRGKQTLKWAVIGLTVIIIGKGFFTFIRSIIDLAK